MLRPLPLLTALVLSGPVAFGLVGTVLPAIGLGPLGQGLSAGPMRDALSWPGLPRALAVALGSGTLATIGALGLTLVVLAGWHGTRAMRWLERALSPLLSVPHAAAALGLAFLIAPSGWAMRAPALLMGWDRPPMLPFPQDPWGLSLTAGLVAKEMPFLLLMALAALPQVDPARRLRVARSLGQGRVAGWMKAVAPGVVRQVRLPVLVVLVYGLTNVDVAVILGPSTPPTLPVQITRWMLDPDLGRRAVGAAAALILMAAVAATLGLWWAAGRATAGAVRRWTESGRGLPEAPARIAGLLAGGLSAAAVLLGLAALALWSLAGAWRFPDLWPETLTLRSWRREGGPLLAVTRDTLAIAAISVAVSVMLAIGCLEAEHRHRLPAASRALWLLYLPLLVPQIVFLPGLAVLPFWFDLRPGVALVAAVHVVFVLPYVFLSLSGPWRAWDARFAKVAAGLGASDDRVLWRVRLPMLLAPVLTAAAVGCAVSVGQYLPTLLVGAGRVPTLTTEAVALSAGGDRRTIGVWGLGQTLAALVPFALALALPAWLHRDRRGLRHG